MTVTREMAYSARQAPVVAPDKGSFPLDHDGACKPQMSALMACLKESQGETFPCRQLSIKYLECRMDKGLMAKESLPKLGFHEEGGEQGLARSQQENTSGGVDATRLKERKGFVSGLEAKPLIVKKD